MSSFLSFLASIPYFPYPHFMALAPLDVWARLLFFPPATIPIRYWPRLVFALATSALATAIMLPERLLFALWFRLNRRVVDPARQPVFILGYYRSGTTHLQYLLDCDPNFFSPKWFHTLAPQGFVPSWTFLRFFLIPFMPSTRLVDATAFDPEAPSEDDFALNNWALASALPGRAVLPQARQFYDRFHDLRTLSATELARWRRCQFAFVYKLGLISGNRRLLLKTPSHTARVDTLMEMFPEARFIHLTRDPKAVIRSNLALLQSAQQHYGLQDPLSAEEIQDELVRQYIDTEKSYLDHRGKIPQGQLAELRFQDLVADPVGEIRRIYRELNLPFTESLERRLLTQLAHTRNYAPNAYLDWTKEQEGRLAPLLAPLIEEFHHDRPPIPPVTAALITVNLDETLGSPRALAVAAGLATALTCAIVWLFISRLTHRHNIWMVWPAGIAIGYAVRRNAGSGSRRLGLWAAFLSLVILVGAAFFYSQEIRYAGHEHVPWATLWSTALRRFTNGAHLFWSFMGLMTAYRLGSRHRL